MKDKTSQTYQFGHTKETQALFPDKTASRLGLSYEGSSKKRKTHTSGPDVALTAAPWNMFTRKYSSLFQYEKGCEKCILLAVETFLGSNLVF